MNGTYPQLATVNAVVHRDCVEGIGDLPADAIPLTVTSPLDPFAGAGTTPKMALLEGRWLGFEIDARYVAIARERMKKAERSFWAS
ncbi:MAG: hypothetical protein U0791_23900 [Gemmataceae bacterium]